MSAPGMIDRAFLGLLREVLSDGELIDTSGESMGVFGRSVSFDVPESEFPLASTAGQSPDDVVEAARGILRGSGLEAALLASGAATATTAAGWHVHLRRVRGRTFMCAQVPHVADATVDLPLAMASLAMVCRLAAASVLETPGKCTVTFGLIEIPREVIPRARVIVGVRNPAPPTAMRIVGSGPGMLSDHSISTSPPDDTCDAWTVLSGPR